MLTATRHLLSRKLSVATMIEIALWLSIPHALIGIGWAVLHPDYQAQREKQLSSVIPAGVDTELVAFGESILWWPVLVLLPPDPCDEPTPGPLAVRAHLFTAQAGYSTSGNE